MKVPARRYTLGLLAVIATTIAIVDRDASAGRYIVGGPDQLLRELVQQLDPTADAGIKAQITLARALTKAKKLRQALPLWMKLADSGPDALEPAAEAGRLTAELDGIEAALTYCRSFLSHDRAAQTLACVQGAPALTRNALAAQLWLDAVAALPVIERGDIENLRTKRPDLRPVLESIDVCWSGNFKPLQKDYWPGGLDPRPSYKGFASDALYLRLAESTADPQIARCLLSVAAGRCIYQLTRKTECRFPRTIARFTENVAANGPKALSALMRVIFKGKGVLYDQLGSAPKRHPGVERSLLNIHLALAYVFTRLKEPIPETGLRPEVLTTKFHLDRAQFFWHELHPETSLPADLLTDITGSPGK